MPALSASARSSTNQTIKTATTIPSGFHRLFPGTTSLFKNLHPTLPRLHSFGTTSKGAWAGYGNRQVTANNITGGVSGWIVPSTSCNPKNTNPQLNALLEWYDAYSGGSFGFAGLYLICSKGSSGLASAYMGDSYSGFSTKVKVGDAITAYVAAYNSTTFEFYVADWTSSSYVFDLENTGAQLAFTDANSILTTFTGCSTTTGICPQVLYGLLDVGGVYNPPVICTFNPDGSTPAYACYSTGFGSKLYFYPVGTASPGTTNIKYIQVKGDTSLSSLFSATGALQSDHASYTVIFKKA
jgi:hypothetical protein